MKLVMEAMIKKYNKLVRDRIPEIIESSGRTCVTEILSDEAYLKMLDAKLDEELAEYHADQNIEELADLMEVIRACAVARGYSVEELEQLRAEKAAERGGFEKKILLKEVREN
jgi:predicted house-cleaning noncanonical NTP pyrophosphatase (MazG superfamily)